MSMVWMQYKCKSGEPLFIYNKETGEHRWLTCCGSLSNVVMVGQPVKLTSTISTQTDDNGCGNGCTSKYIEAHHLALPSCIPLNSMQNDDTPNLALAAVVTDIIDKNCNSRNVIQTPSCTQSGCADDHVDFQCGNNSPQNKFTCTAVKIETEDQCQNDSNASQRSSEAQLLLSVDSKLHDETSDKMMERDDRCLDVRSLTQTSSETQLLLSVDSKLHDETSDKVMERDDYCLDAGSATQTSELELAVSVDDKLGDKISAQNDLNTIIKMETDDCDSESTTMTSHKQPLSKLSGDGNLDSGEHIRIPQNIMMQTSYFHDSTIAAARMPPQVQPKFSANSQHIDCSHLTNADSIGVDQPFVLSNRAMKPLLHLGSDYLIAIEHNYCKSYPSNRMTNDENTDIPPNEICTYTEDDMAIEGEMFADGIVTGHTVRQDITENYSLQYVERVENETGYSQSDLIEEQVMVNVDNCTQLESNLSERGYLVENDAEDSKVKETGEQPQQIDLLQKYVSVRVSSEDCQENNLLENSVNNTKYDQGTQTMMQNCAIIEKDLPESNVVEENVQSHSLKKEKKTLKCSYCGKDLTAKTKSKYILHVRTHTKEKPFECSVCSKKFGRKDHLDLHQRTHSGLRVHKCTYCEKTFTTKSGLNRHEKIHIKKETLHCSYCNEAFASKVVLDGHFKKLHHKCNFEHENS